MERVVVGVDGTDSSRSALEWAAERARHDGAELVVVHAWVPPTMTYGVWLAPYAPALEAKGHFRAAAEATVEAALADVDLTGVPLTVRVLEGHAGAALVRESADADLVVLGHRGRRPFAEFVLGSTAQYVSRHGDVPVVTVPARVRAELLGAA